MKRERSIVSNDYPFNLIQNLEDTKIIYIKFYLFLKEIFKEFPIEIIQLIILQVKIKCSFTKCDIEDSISILNNKENNQFGICHICVISSNNIKFKGFLCYKNFHSGVMNKCIICKLSSCSYHDNHVLCDICKEFVCDNCKKHMKFTGIYKKCSKCLSEGIFAVKRRLQKKDSEL